MNMRLNETSDAELLQLYLQGDAEAFKVLELRYRRQLFAWLSSSLGNRGDAEDIYQDIWFKIIKNAERFKEVSFKAWMWKIARNRVIDFRRKKKPDLTLDQCFGDEETPLIDKIKSPAASPAGELETEDMRRVVMQIVETLPDNQREVFLMRVEAHLSFKEIATALDVPLNTALGRMHDAMKKIKDRLTEVR